ncbi:hypothetical protein [Streptomyces sp. NPDC086766]|uniref:hypothetical protein n=1 Tax=Streptomyces sp. NPDC086766 TaxID=3365754 RepID=UPI00380FA535
MEGTVGGALVLAGRPVVTPVNWVEALFVLSWVALLGVLCFLVAVDYRNLGLWVYDYLDRRNTVTARPMMTPDRFRVVAGAMAAVFLCVLVYLLGGLVVDAGAGRHT